MASKRHIAADVDRGLILACALTPANRPEEEAVPALQIELARQAVTVVQLVIDRGYINSTLVDKLSLCSGPRPAGNHLRHVLPHHIVDVTVGGEAKTQRTCGVERAGPAGDDTRHAVVGFAAHARAHGRACKPLEAVQHLPGSDAQSREVQHALAVQFCAGDAGGVREIACDRARRADPDRRLERDGSSLPRAARG